MLPAALNLASFAWLLTLHPVASGRTYAAYGGIYVATTLVWLVLVDGVRLNRIDLPGGDLILAGVLVMVAGHWRSAWFGDAARLRSRRSSCWCTYGAVN